MYYYIFPLEIRFVIKAGFYYLFNSKGAPFMGRSKLLSCFSSHILYKSLSIVLLQYNLKISHHLEKKFSKLISSCKVKQTYASSVFILSMTEIFSSFSYRVSNIVMNNWKSFLQEKSMKQYMTEVIKEEIKKNEQKSE